LYSCIFLHALYVSASGKAMSVQFYQASSRDDQVMQGKFSTPA